MKSENEELKKEAYENLEKDLPLTIKQEKFCNLYIKYANATKAYREAYDVTSSSHATHNPQASRLVSTPKIAARIFELKSELARDFKLNMEMIYKEWAARYYHAIEENDNKTAAKILADISKHLGTSASDAEKILQAQVTFLVPDDDRVKKESETKN